MQDVDNARALGRLEGKVDAIAADLSELKLTLRTRNAMKWQTYSALATGILATILSTFILVHLGIK